VAWRYPAFMKMEDASAWSFRLPQGEGPFCARVSGNMLDMDDRQFCLSEFVQENLGICRSIFDTDKFHVAAMEIIILKVNQY
jgi:hypothetical protein